MAFCTNCGTQLPEGVASCPSCGSVVYEHMNNPAQEMPKEQFNQPVYTPPGTYYQPPVENYQQPQQVYQPPQPQQIPYTDLYYQQQTYQIAKDISSAKILGIVSIIFAFISSIICWICGGIGLSKANKAIQFAQMTGNLQLLNEAESAKKLNKAGIILSVVLVAIVVFIGIFGTLGYLGSEDLMNF